MSTRYYPRYVLGNPQLRVFLPDFWMILVKNRSRNVPANRVTFKVSPQMTAYDVRNYLEKIYKLPVVEVNTVINTGKITPDVLGKEMVKEPDVRICHVTLPEEMKFKHPAEDLFRGGRKEQDQSKLKQMEKVLAEIKSKKEQIQKETWRRGGPKLPTWFNL